MREFVARLGPVIKSCHAKDTIMRPSLTVHIDEVRPGLGTLDYAVLLHVLEQIDPDMPVMLEHLPEASEYLAAAAYVRSIADREGLRL
jgi:sugar phosphate isomerase/epimerase